MHTLHKNVYFLAMCLSALAGFIDAIGFLHLGGYFISFMSGNTTRLAVSLIEHNISGIALLGGILATFVAGTMLGTFVRHFSPAAQAAVNVLGFVTALLAGAALSYAAEWNFLAITLMILAMGAENAVFQRGGDVIVGLTYMTGTLVKLGQRLAQALLGGDAYAWTPYLLLWLGLILGGITGTLAFHYLGLSSLWIATLWSAALTTAAALAKNHLSI